MAMTRAVCIPPSHTTISTGSPRSIIQIQRQLRIIIMIRRVFPRERRARLRPIPTRVRALQLEGAPELFVELTETDCGFFKAQGARVSASTDIVVARASEVIVRDSPAIPPFNSAN